MRALRILRVALRRAARPRPGPRKRWVLALAFVLIPLWQAGFGGARLDDRWKISASSGLHEQRRFVFFLYHLGLFPVASEVDPPADDEDGARFLIRERGSSLLMEVGHTIRYGDLGKTFLYLPDALIKGSTRDPRLAPAHYLAFTAALLALFSAFWWARHVRLGAITVVLLGSNVFQLYEIYFRENIFSWPITIAIFVLAIHVPLILLSKSVPRFWWIAAPIITALLLATIRQVRTEPVLIGASAALTYFVLARSWAWRVAGPALLAVIFFLTSAGYNTLFDRSWLRAQEIVTQAGGHPLPGAREQYHIVWHPIWCGLGDFGADKGYRWDDRAAASYALPILEERYGVDVPAWDPTSLNFRDHFLDAAKKYYGVPYLLPHYSDVVRDKVVADVAEDPLWYLGVLAKRVWRILSETTPIGIAIRTFALRVPVHGVFAIVLAFAALWGLGARRRRAFAVFFAFFLPLSLPALLIYSGGGVTYYGALHVLPVAFAIHVLSSRLRVRRKSE